MRIIEVEKCGIGFCPYCIPDSTNKAINYCAWYQEPKKISSNVKTFPIICELTKTIKE